MDETGQGVEWALGLDGEELGLVQMALRAAIIYVSALAMVRLGEKRFFGKNTAFDLILGIIFGSVVSRAINGSAALLPTLGAGFVLIALHWLFAKVSLYWDSFGTLVKGSPRVLVRDGEVLWEAMRRSNLSERDLESALRMEANTKELDKVEEARLERSGDISVIKRSLGPEVLEVHVADGVQTVRIRLE